MNKIVLKLFFVFMLTFFNIEIYAENATPEMVLKKYEEIMSPQNYDISFSLEVHKADKPVKTYEMRAISKGEDKSKVIFSAPASVKGQEVLRVGDSSWVYLPNVKRVSSISGKDDFQGGDFNNSDILKTKLSSEYSVKFSPTMKTDYILELVSKNEKSNYSKIILTLSKKDNMPIEANYYAASGSLLKKAIFSDTKTFSGDYTRPSIMKMSDGGQSGNYSVLKIEKMKINVDFPDSQFNRNNLGQ